MIRTIFRALAITAITATALLAVLSPALAQGNWSWTDLSDKIAERQNRPVWAMAYAQPFWYFTDGQDLWSGGHVWKTEGSIMTDITTEIRNNNISRVDDIVSDGQTVLFLQNVAPRNNSIKVLAYDGNYTNLTSTVEQNLSSNEGVVSITGANSTFGILTSYGRVLLMSLSSTVHMITVQLPASTSQAAYIQNGTSNNDGTPLTMGLQPVQGKWLAYWKSNGTTHFETIDQYGAILPVNYPGSNTDDILAFTSNGQSAIIAGFGSNHAVGAASTFAYIDNGNTFQTVTQSASMPNWSGSLATWDGTSWLFLQGKNLYRLDGTTFTSLGQTNDLFLTASGNTSGTFLLGGAVSDQYSGNNPSSPLMLKLAKATEDYNNTGNTTSGTVGGGRTYTSFNGPTITTSGNPSSFEISNGNAFDYIANATDPNGVDHIDLYVNSFKIHTCYTSSCDFSSTYFTNGLSTRAIPLQVIATDHNGNTTQTANETLTVDQSANSNTNNTNGTAQTQNGISFWTWFDPNLTSISSNQTVTYFVGANSAVGLSSIQIYANGTVRQTCSLNNATGNQQCSAVLYGEDYSLNTNVAVNAKITDKNGNIAWTTLQNIYVSQNGSTNNTNNASDMSVWTTLDPTGSTLNQNSTVTLHVQSTATRGLQTLRVFVNNNIQRTCNFSQAYGTQSCDITLSGNSYSNGQQLSLNAEATDIDGKISWSDTKMVTVQNNNSTTNNNSTGNATSWIASTPDVSTIQTSDQVIFTVKATDPQGIRSIDMYVNGSIYHTCDLGYTSNGTVGCFAYISGKSYSASTSVFVNAKITDGNGDVTWSQSRTYTIQSAGDAAKEKSFYSTFLTDTPPDNQIASAKLLESTGTDVNGKITRATFFDSAPLRRDQSTTFGVGAVDTDGIKRIEIYVNGTIAHTCDLGRAYGNQTCWTTIYGGNYTVGTNVAVNAKITNGTDQVSWTPLLTLNITDVNSTDNSTIGNTDSATWIWSDPNRALVGNSIMLQTNQNVTFYVGANDPEGIRRIDMYVNGNVTHSCDLGYTSNGNVQCSTYISGNSYNVGTSVFVNAKITDGNGNVTWSHSQTFLIQSANGTSGTNSTPAQTTSWVWSDPSATTVASNQNIVFNVGAWSPNGIRKIEMFVNDSPVSRICDPGYVTTGNFTCDYHTYGGALLGASIGLHARITDGNGNVSWSDTKTFTITPATSGTGTIPTNLPGSVSVTSNHDAGFTNNETISFAASATDQDGVQKIELLVNGVLVKTCTNTNSCGYTGGPYNDRTTVSYGARMTDTKGNALWTGYKTISKR